MVHKSSSDKPFYTLNELAKSGKLPWRNIATVRQYVNEYSDIFKPQLRGSGPKKRYIIFTKNIAIFLDLFYKGELKGIQKLGKEKDRDFQKFLTIASFGMDDKAKRFREEAERKGFRTDFIPLNERREFMNIFSNKIKTYRVLILIVRTIGNKITFQFGNPVGQNLFTKATSHIGIEEKGIILWTDISLGKRLETDFLKKGKARFYKEIIYTDVHGKKEIEEINKILNELKENNLLDSSPQKLIPKPSSRKGKKYLK